MNKHKEVGHMRHANTKPSSLDHIQMSSIINDPYSTTGNSYGSIVHPSDDSKVCITIPEINELYSITKDLEEKKPQ